MKTRVMVLMLLCAAALVFFLASCASETVKQEPPPGQAIASGDVAKGKVLFEDPKLGGGTSGKSCASCHKGGKGLENVADKAEFKAMGKTYKSLEEVTNYFIETAQLGKALDTKSDQMRDLIAYIKSIGKGR